MCWWWAGAFGIWRNRRNRLIRRWLWLIRCRAKWLLWHLERGIHWVSAFHAYWRNPATIRRMLSPKAAGRAWWIWVRPRAATRWTTVTRRTSKSTIPMMMNRRKLQRIIRFIQRHPSAWIGTRSTPYSTSTSSSNSIRTVPAIPVIRTEHRQCSRLTWWIPLTSTFRTRPDRLLPAALPRPIYPTWTEVFQVPLRPEAFLLRRRRPASPRPWLRCNWDPWHPHRNLYHRPTCSSAW